MWKAEEKMYLLRAEAARTARAYRSDLIEVYSDETEITQLAIRSGLRALQPGFGVGGFHPGQKDSYESLRALLRHRKPFLLFYDLDSQLAGWQLGCGCRGDDHHHYECPGILRSSLPGEEHLGKPLAPSSNPQAQAVLRREVSTGASMSVRF